MLDEVTAAKIWVSIFRVDSKTKVQVVSDPIDSDTRSAKAFITAFGKPYYTDVVSKISRIDSIEYYQDLTFIRVFWPFPSKFDIRALVVPFSCLKVIK